MPYGSYQYWDNLGNLWAISVPTDFAAVLGLVPASGNEPYLDATISPRTANYRSNSPVNIRSAVVGTVTAFGANLPAQLIVQGVQYNLLSAVGEAVPPYPFVQLPIASGQQGPPGQLPDINSGSVLGNISGSTAPATGLSGPQITALLAVFTSVTAGLVPQPGVSTGKFLRDDGTWAIP